MIVLVEYPDGSEARRDVVDAALELRNAMEDDYRNGKWGRVVNPVTGREMPVRISVEVVGA